MIVNPVWFDFGVAAILVVAAIALVTWFLKYKASRSERRMMKMLLNVGVDPEIIDEGDQEAIMHAVRKRCRRCQAEDECERWLAGEVEGGNVFCPNANIFESLAAIHKQVTLRNT
jgi:hypothetical protein